MDYIKEIEKNKGWFNRFSLLLIILILGLILSVLIFIELPEEISLKKIKENSTEICFGVETNLNLDVDYQFKTRNSSKIEIPTELIIFNSENSSICIQKNLIEEHTDYINVIAYQEKSLAELAWQYYLKKNKK